MTAVILRVSLWYFLSAVNSLSSNSLIRPPMATTTDR